MKKVIFSIVVLVIATANIKTQAQDQYNNVASYTTTSSSDNQVWYAANNNLNLPRAVIEQHATKQFLDISDIKTADRKRKMLPLQLKKAQKNFFAAYVKNKTAPVVISTDTTVQTSFNRNIDRLYELLRQDILSYRRTYDGEVNKNLAISINSLTCLLKVGKNAVKNNKKKTMDEKEFLYTLYGVYNNVDVFLHQYLK